MFNFSQRILARITLLIVICKFEKKGIKVKWFDASDTWLESTLQRINDWIGSCRNKCLQGNAPGTWSGHMAWSYARLSWPRRVPSALHRSGTEPPAPCHRALEPSTCLCVKLPVNLSWNVVFFLWNNYFAWLSKWSKNILHIITKSRLFRFLSLLVNSLR